MCDIESDESINTKQSYNICNKTELCDKTELCNTFFESIDCQWHICMICGTGCLSELECMLQMLKNNITSISYGLSKMFE